MSYPHKIRPHRITTEAWLQPLCAVKEPEHHTGKHCHIVTPENGVSELFCDAHCPHCRKNGKGERARALAEVITA